MALAKFICPHCERPGEVQVTAVTRSRQCPSCGEQVMLQVSEKTKKGKSKRKALLVAAAGTASPLPERAPDSAPIVAAASPAIAPRSTTTNTNPTAEAAPTADLGKAKDKEELHLPPTFQMTLPVSISGPAYEPQALSGEAFDRMKMDPEIIATRRFFFFGVAATLLVIVCASLTHTFWSTATPSEAKPKQTEAQRVIAEEAPKITKRPANTIGLSSGSAAPLANQIQRPAAINFNTAALDVGAADRTTPEPPPPTKPIQLVPPVKQ